MRGAVGRLISSLGNLASSEMSKSLHEVARLPVDDKTSAPRTACWMRRARLASLLESQR
jgi:hypothetical protein